ncbi:MAG: polymerase, partial [Nevskia sp.]|nr:polymerase [Nevskia sp.]
MNASTSQPVRPLILIDASGWLFRAYHALPPLTTARGEHTGGVLGMANMLRRLLKEYTPEEIAVVFDAPGKTFRDEIYPEYKANRDATPEDLSAQFPMIAELVQAMGLPLLAIVGVEADDVIGTLASQADAAGKDVLIVTSDKDLAQLVNERISLLDTMKNRRMDPAGVVEKFGVPPKCIIDYLALVGDTSDNIPGVPLVGPKTAAKWLVEHGSLDAIIEHAAEIKGKAGENLRASLPQIPMARQLATIRCDVELPLRFDQLHPAAPDVDKLAGLYRRFEFRRLLEELEAGAPPAPAVETAASAVVVGEVPAAEAPAAAPAVS